jgi:hypothetical protein
MASRNDVGFRHCEPFDSCSRQAKAKQSHDMNSIEKITSVALPLRQLASSLKMSTHSHIIWPFIQKVNRYLSHSVLLMLDPVMTTQKRAAHWSCSFSFN